MILHTPLLIISQLVNLDQGLEPEEFLDAAVGLFALLLFALLISAYRKTLPQEAPDRLRRVCSVRGGRRGAAARRVRVHSRPPDRPGHHDCDRALHTPAILPRSSRQAVVQKCGPADGDSRQLIIDSRSLLTESGHPATADQISTCSA